MSMLFFIPLYIIIGVCWMIFHACYINKIDRPTGGALYPIFMIFAWPVGILIHGINNIHKQIIDIICKTKDNHK